MLRAGLDVGKDSGSGDCKENALQACSWGDITLVSYLITFIFTLSHWENKQVDPAQGPGQLLL